MGESTSGLARLTVEDFKPLVGQPFELSLPDGSVGAAVLIEARALSPARPDRRAAFALLFRPPVPFTPEQQATRRITHPALGALDLFLVPLRPDAAGPRLEAIFT